MPDIITTGTGLIVAGKLLGKTADKISVDLAQLYERGRDSIIEAAARKTNIESSGIANMRVAREALMNGSFTDSAICAEYFGGAIASARSIDGKDDTGISFLSIISGLSSNQLLLHYLIYSSLRKSTFETQQQINVANLADLKTMVLVLDLEEVQDKFAINYETDIIALYQRGLITEKYNAGSRSSFWLDNKLSDQEKFQTLIAVQPTTLGVQLFMQAHGQLSGWRDYSVESHDLDEFPEIESLEHMLILEDSN